MKKFFLSVTTLLSLAVFVKAQNSSPYWSLAGNSNVNKSSKLGTTNDYSVRFYTNNVQRMIINSPSGLVGIGTPTPTARLHVNSASGSNAFRAQVNGSTKLLVHRGGGVAIGANGTPPANGLYVSGEVGIGTNLPSEKLHVKGNAIIDGSLTARSTYINGSLYVDNIAERLGTGIISSGTWGMEAYGSDYGLYAEASIALD